MDDIVANYKVAQVLRTYKGHEKDRVESFQAAVAKKIAEKETAYNNLLTNMTSAVLPAEVIKDISDKMSKLKNEIEELKEATPPEDYSVDVIQEWLQSIRNAPDEKAVHLLIDRIEAVRTEDKTDFNISTTLKPVLENMVAGEGFEVTEQNFLYFFQCKSVLFCKKSEILCISQTIRFYDIEAVKGQNKGQNAGKERPEIWPEKFTNFSAYMEEKLWRAVHYLLLKISFTAVTLWAEILWIQHTVKEHAMDKLRPAKSKSCVHEVQGGQPMMENKESALDRLARECSAAREYSDQLLLSLVRDNAGTAFGREHGFSEIRSPADYKRRVPFSEYDDYADAIERMTKGEKNLLTAYPVLLYATTSGSVGVVKKIPMTDRAFRMNRVFANTYMDVLRRYMLDRTGKPYEEGKRVYLSVVSSSHVEDGTPLGVISSHLLLSHKEEIVKRLAGPPETMFGDGELDYTYLKAFYALKERNVTFLVGVFMSSVSDFFSYLEQNWESLCRDIEVGRLDSEKNIPEELAARLNESLSPDPERAEELRRIFRQGFSQPVVSAVWPRFAALNAIGSGSFAVYTEKVRRFTGDIPISMGVYAASEGMIAVITHMDSAEYTVVPEAGYFEFIPEEDMELPAERLREHTLSLDELTPGKNYEIIVTNLSGLYRYRIGDVIRILGYSGQSPVICFAYRKHQMLNITGEKTTEDTIQYAVDRMSEKTGLKVVEWSVYADYSLSPARYVLFIEPVRPLSAEQEHQLRDLLEEGIAEKNESYARHLENGTLSPLKLEILEMQTYRLYRDLLIYKGASANQIKPVHVIDNPVKEKFFFGLAEEEV